jgi:putative oxidoreductase
MSAALLSHMRAWAPLPLRLALGFGFVYHGYPKLFTVEGNESLAGMLAGLGIPAPAVGAYLIGGFEFFGGILLLLGFGVRIVSGIGAVEMAVAAYLVHWSAGFNFMNVTGTTADGAMQFGLPGYEVNVLYIAGFLSLALSGSGPLSVPPLSHRVQEPEEVTPEPEPTYAG